MITLTNAQNVVYRDLTNWVRTPDRSERLVFGFAGTGKTTIAAQFIRDMGVRALTATLTGKAAHVLRRKGIDAQTIHSLIYRPVPGSNPLRFALNEDSPLWDADLLVLDECSMIGDDLAEDLRGFGKKILAFGDPGQLPPINGGGAFVRREPDHFLTEIHRQALESPILRLATAARLGEPIALGDHDGAAVVRRANLDDIQRLGWQVICGTHRRRWRITRLIREHLGFTSVYPDAGERLLCCKNNRDRGLFNGATGTATARTRETDGPLVYVQAQLEGSDAIRTFPTSRRLFLEHVEGRALPDEPYRREVELFDHGYVLTCHKSQGSEFDNVVLVDDSAAFSEHRNRWLYTGITRASERLILLR